MERPPSPEPRRASNSWPRRAALALALALCAGLLPSRTAEAGIFDWLLGKPRGQRARRTEAQRRIRANLRHGIDAQRDAMAAYMPYSVLLTAARKGEAHIVTRDGEAAIPFPEEPRTPQVMVWLDVGQSKTSIWVCDDKNRVQQKVTLPYRPKVKHDRDRLARSGWLTIDNKPRKIDCAVLSRLGHVRVAVEHKAVKIERGKWGTRHEIAQREAETRALEQLVRSALIVARNPEVGVRDDEGRFFRLRFGGLFPSKQDVVGTPH